jgi:hypothetical protein
MLIVLVLVFQAAASAFPHAWWDPAWRYRQRVSISPSEIDEDLVDFPITLRLKDAEFARTLAKPGHSSPRH